MLIDSAVPGAWANLGLGVADLKALNPALIHASLTAFGQDGPKAGWAATDLTVWAAAGPLVLTGDNDRAPVRVPLGQAFAHGAPELAGAVVAALIERGRSGHGQHIDVSAQQAAARKDSAMRPRATRSGRPTSSSCSPASSRPRSTKGSSAWWARSVRPSRRPR